MALESDILEAHKYCTVVSGLHKVTLYYYYKFSVMSVILTLPPLIINTDFPASKKQVTCSLLNNYYVHLEYSLQSQILKLNSLYHAWRLKNIFFLITFC